MARTLIRCLFGEELTDWGDRVMENGALRQDVLTGELAFHRQLKEKIGHGLPDKAAILPETELRAIVDNAAVRREMLLRK